ncbi:SDR family oxidoreductase [Brevundimonas sp.]|uniref:SDR family oxidoreductase n=1 Tax=Brevundimonas sp. TaxID=1871086 RepID=UPI001A23D930|nr:SDR family oxidoreductase [Brevundimonas sp.]MBJ7483120.1 SDR family oxidoreductase [Brevundimonas sp.]
MAVIVVTGGFGALGRAVVRHLADAGHQVAAVDMAPVPTESLAKLTLGGVDLAEEHVVAEAYRNVVSDLGAIGGVVNIAGGFVWETVADGSLDSFDRMYRMNLRTAAASCRAAIPLLVEGSAIVNVGAAGAVRPGTGFAAYAASKTGVHALTESLAEELKGRGIRVNAVLPTIIDTPTNRADMPDADTSAWVRPEAAARVIAFLLSRESGAVTGAAIPLSLAG